MIFFGVGTSGSESVSETGFSGVVAELENKFVNIEKNPPPPSPVDSGTTGEVVFETISETSLPVFSGSDSGSSGSSVSGVVVGGVSLWLGVVGGVSLWLGVVEGVFSANYVSEVSWFVWTVSATEFKILFLFKWNFLFLNNFRLLLLCCAVVAGSSVGGGVFSEPFTGGVSPSP